MLSPFLLFFILLLLELCGPALAIRILGLGGIKTDQPTKVSHKEKAKISDRLLEEAMNNIEKLTNITNTLARDPLTGKVVTPDPAVVQQRLEERRKKLEEERRKQEEKRAAEAAAAAAAEAAPWLAGAGKEPHIYMYVCIYMHVSVYVCMHV
jgi:hypothetical protein